MKAEDWSCLLLHAQFLILALLHHLHNPPINMQRRDYKKTTPLIPTFYTRRKYVPDNLLAADQCIVNILLGTPASLNKSLLKILSSFISTISSLMKFWIKHKTFWKYIIIRVYEMINKSIKWSQTGRMIVSSSAMVTSSGCRQAGECWAGLGWLGWAGLGWAGR